MLRIFRNLLHAGGGPDSPRRPVDSDSVENATTALLTKMIGADFAVQESERRTLSEGVRQLLDLNDQETEELLQVGKAKADEAVSLYEFTRVLQREMSLDNKVRVIELLWRIAFADGELDSQEEFLVRKVARLLHVPQADFIAAKQRARDEKLGQS